MIVENIESQSGCDDMQQTVSETISGHRGTVATGLAVSPSWVQWPGTVCRLISAIHVANSRLNCSSGHITWHH